MRYIMKGGVWKNSQDEILKAAIMKYGLNQWSRISSLLQRKSAKQCKQRWYQWLDPSIKKTEWTRAEDQKLLQLARVFPSQWRTVAPFVGRTPTQCYQRYEKLLDVAQGKSVKESEDLKKLRPGQIDPNPQTKPARLDPIDMDQDQKQMLAQVRVRLANTKGKKAKRKERQKIIEQARRLAQLQKLRQLQMAGVDNIPTVKQIKRMKQNKSIDYNKAIPFKRQVPQFAYSHSEEEEISTKGTSFATTINLQNIQGKRRDVEEELQRKLDKRRMKKLKQRDLKTVLNMKNQFEKPASFPIQLPQPQITQKDLEDMKKFNITTPLNSQLMSNANQTPYGMTPQNRIMFEAKINMSLNHQDLADQDLDGVQALNYLKQYEKDKKMGLNQPMRSIDRVISERMKTPISNQWEQDNEKKVKSLFKNLKRPENVVQFQIPQQQQQQERELVMDAQQLQSLQKKKRQEEQQKRRQQNTSVMKRNLPRPLSIPQELAKQYKNQINRLINVQMLSLIYSDAIDHPMQNCVFSDEEIPYKEYVSQVSLQEARRLVQQQMSKINQNDFQIKKIDTLRKRVKLDFKKKEAKVMKAKLSQKQEHIESFNKYFINQDNYKSFVKHTQSNTKKSKKLLGGYQKIIKTKFEQINQMNFQLQRLRRQKSILLDMKSVQVKAIQQRAQQLSKDYKTIYNAI